MDKPHVGHRERLRSRAVASEMEALRPHELVEYLLFFAVPRQNVNPLAHALLDRFGTLQSLFCAQPEDLAQVPGVSAATADWLHLTGEAVLDYIEGGKNSPRILTRHAAKRYLSRHFQRSDTESCWMLCLSGSGSVLRLAPIDASDRWYAPENTRRMIEEAVGCRAAHIVLAQNRQESRFSPEEQRQTDLLMNAMRWMNICLVEHMLMSPGGESVCYATNPHLKDDELAELTPLMAHWLDEE